MIIPTIRPPLSMGDWMVPGPQGVRRVHEFVVNPLPFYPHGHI